MSPAETITRHFRGDWHGTQGAFPTPGHSARDRALTVKDGDAGDVVFYCHNDPAFDWRALKDECRRLGLLPEREASTGGGWRETGCYEYVREDGEVAYRQVRKEKVGEGKRFVAQRPDGRGGWVNKLGDVPRILYRLPAIKAAITRSVLKDEPLPLIYLTEGERKADKLASWGLLATAVAFGARGWRDIYAEALTGCTVAILPDNDDEGRGFAAKARDSIVAAGGRAVIVALPGLPEKGDIIDWRGDATVLVTLVETAIRTPGDPASSAGTEPWQLPIIDSAEWIGREPPDRRWIVKSWLARGTAAIWVGMDGVGKSLGAQQLVTCAAWGCPFLGLETLHIPALYVTCEDDETELWRRQRSINTALNIPIDAAPAILSTLVGGINVTLGTFGADGTLHLSPCYHAIKTAALAAGVGLIVLDNLAHMFPGNEIVRREVAAFCAVLDRLAIDTDAAVIVLAHPNKSGDEYSGSTAWSAHVRQRWFMERGDKDIDPDTRIIRKSKANYSSTGDEIAFRWHQWAFVQDADLPDDQRAEIAAVAMAAKDNAIFLDCLSEMSRQERSVSEKHSSSFAPTVFAKMSESKSIGKDRLEGAMDRLFRLGSIKRGTLPWKRDRKEVEGLYDVR